MLADCILALRNEGIALAITIVTPDVFRGCSVLRLCAILMSLLELLPYPPTMSRLLNIQPHYITKSQRVNHSPEISTSAYRRASSNSGVGFGREAVLESEFVPHYCLV